MKSIELLAPAKDYLSAVAAVDYGADALYIGGAKFGARCAAGNSVEQIARVVEYAHRYGVRVHATLNTLLWDDELAEAEQQARELIAAGVDALIVQDMALRRMELSAELHASTQVCNTTPEGARFLGEVGFARVILERALSLDSIRAICAATRAEVECFVHGAICVGHSGRCFLSRSMSGRSGNRGDCSQPCRLPWDLTTAKGERLIEGKHLLSVRDLNLSGRIGELLDAGVTSFKIEGRLKDINYIKNIVALYRRAVDEALALRPELRRASVGESLAEFTPDASKSFTRGESEYFFGGKRAGVASFDTPKAVGESLGWVVQVERNGFRIEGRGELLAPGDGICFVRRGELVGTNVNSVERGVVIPNRMAGIAAGMELFRNYDHRFNLAVERSRTRRVIATRARVEASAEGLKITFTDCEGVEASAERIQRLEAAKNREANAASLRAQTVKSGDTIFGVTEVELRGEEWFVPASLTTEVRREGLNRLLAARVARPLVHQIVPEGEAIYPSERITAEQNLTNHLAEAFYRDHCVTQIERALELAPTTLGARVMRSSYCLRREVGQCLRERPRLRGELFLEHGAHRYRLEFDCAACEMSLIDESKH